MAAASFQALADVHRWLDGLFLGHQTALLALDLPAARARLAAYERHLLTHIDDEDGRLLPIYEARKGHVPGGGTAFFLGEHRKLQALLEEIKGGLAALDRLAGDALAQRVVSLFDREAFYKSLVEHHHAREQRILFPLLDRLTSEAERADLLGQCASLAACRAAGA